LAGQEGTAVVASKYVVRAAPYIFIRIKAPPKRDL
jgi:hypothetical protein